MDSGCIRGGICRLRELISEHPAEIAYDFRSRFQLSIFDIGGEITYLEAALLLSILVQDTNSWTQAAMSDWKYPVTREWLVGAHTWDLLASVNSKKKPKPYPTPWPNENQNRIGKTTLSRDEVESRLNQMNPKEKPDGR